MTRHFITVEIEAATQVRAVTAVSIALENYCPAGGEGIRFIDAFPQKQPAGRPKAFAEQACVIGKCDDVVKIHCDDPDDANELFEWLTEQ